MYCTTAYLEKSQWGGMLMLAVVIVSPVTPAIESTVPVSNNYKKKHQIKKYFKLFLQMFTESTKTYLFTYNVTG